MDDTIKKLLDKAARNAGELNEQATPASQATPVQSFPARITIVEDMYHQVQGEEAYHLHDGFTRQTKVIEQPYCRWCYATTDWKKVDLGWICDALGLLIIQNRSKSSLKDDKLNANNTILLAYSPHGKDGWLIPPGESFRGLPSNPSELQISTNGAEKVKFILYAFPN